MHTDLLAPPAEGRRRQCPCGAVTEHPHNLCRQVPGPDQLATEDHADAAAA